MNVKFKKLMSVLLCCAMLFGTIPVNAFAAEETAESNITAEENVVEVPVENAPLTLETVLPERPSEDGSVSTPASGESTEDPAQILYNKVKSFGDYEALRTYLNSLSAEQLELLKKFFAAKELDLNEWMNTFLKRDPVSDEAALAAIAEEQPVMEEPVVEEPEVAEPEVAEPVVEEPVVEEPVVEEPVVEEPVVEQPVLEEPVVEDHKAEEPVVEEQTIFASEVIEAPVTYKGGGGNHGTPTSSNHVDIACENLTAQIGDETVTFSFSTEDVENGLVEVYINDTRYTDTAGYSTDGDGNSQVRIDGTFAIGTEENPVVYTVKLRKLVTTEKYGDVYVTLSVTTNYWADNNVCPGNGIDVALGVGEGEDTRYTQLNISKVVKGFTFSEDKTFTFDIMSGNTVVKTATVEVKAGSTGGVAIVTGLDEGTYTVVERSEGTAAEGYTLAVSYSTESIAVNKETAASVEVTNTYAAEKSLNPDPGTLVIPFEKIWDDEGLTQYRPDSVTVQLIKIGADGKESEVETKTVTAASDWKCEFDISNISLVDTTFVVREVPVDKYEEVDRKNPEVSFTLPSVSDWSRATDCSDVTRDIVNDDEKSILVGKKGNGFVVWSVNPLAIAERAVVVDAIKAVNGFNSISLSSTVFISGFGGSYGGMTVTENQIVFGQTSDWSFYALGTYTRSSSSANGASITNKLIPQTTSVSVSKIWSDADNQDGIRPNDVTINLLADGEATGKTLVLNAENNWSGSFTNLEKYANGEEIIYTVEEVKVDGYDVEITGSQENGYTVTNTHVPEQTTVTVTKIWNDADDQDGIRPNDVTINLLADGEATGKTLVLNAGNNWTATFENLEKKAEGQDIAYTVAEANVPEGYTVAVTGTQSEGYTVTNTHAPEKTSVTVTKVWKDNDNQDGIRPDSVTINLLADGEATGKTLELSDANNWTGTFTELDKFAAGEEIEYTVVEVTVPDGYAAAVEGNVITNTHIPATVEVSGTKTWADNDDQDGLRPEYITIHLLADNEVIDTKTVAAIDNWSWSFENLPKYKDHGTEIVYTITEEAVDKYETTVNGFDVTNSYTPETVEVSGAKTWNDANNQDGKRPASITINLLADGVEVENVTVTEADGWAWSFKNLPKYKNHGTPIVYSITETGIEDYSTEYDGYNVINSYTPEQTSVTVAKAWVDSNDQDGLRPESVTIELLANDEATDKTLVLNADNNWTGSFTELDKFAEGKEIAYTVAEVEVKGYTTAITGNQTDGYTVTNTHTPEVVEVSGAKTWVDNDNQDGKRPESITIHLLADDQVIETVTVTEADGWAWSFENLPKYRDHGTEIVYTITEDAVAEYETVVSGYNVTNTHEIEKTEVNVAKVWKDNDDQDGIRPNDVTIQLLADGEATGKTLVLNAGNNWAGTFEDLDKYAAGEIIAYTVAELEVSGYESVVTGSQADGYTVTNTHEPATVAVSGKKTWNDANDQDGARPESITINLLANGEVIATKTVTAADGWAWSFNDLPKYENHGTEITYSITENAVEDYTTTYNGYNVTNTHTPEETSVTVTKSWKDNNDQDGIRPNDVTIQLLANGKATGKTLVLNDANGWTGSFTGLDKFAEGEEITYTVEELTVEGYASEITGSQTAGFTVTNTHEPETLEVSGKKTWDDAEDQDGKRPESITIRLLANGVEVENVTVTEADGWAWSFTDLPKYENHGTEITYTVTEDSVEGYTATIDGFNVTNKYTPEETSVTVTKSWQDNNDQDGIRPESITVNLLANGEKTASAQLTAEGNWTYTFQELDVYAKGEKIVYTVEEEAVEGYETVITGDASKGFTVTNSHTPEVVEVAGKKTWDDDNNRDGKRPESITVRLLANGKEVASTTVTAADAWSFEFTNLPKYEAGEQIVYTVTEDAVAGYSVEYSDENFDITNRYTPGKTSITVTKRWIDGYDHDGIRPRSVTIYLYADDVKIAQLKLTAKDNWTGVFDDLHVYENGRPIEYTISEKSVRGYNATFTGNAEQGFTVTNTHNIIPKTGDESNLPLYTGLFGASFSVLAVLMFLAKPKKKGKYAR